MVGLDSLYAMLARPIRLSINRKRLIVEETSSSASLTDDNHQAAESPLPPSLERRHAQQDRRRGDRRCAAERQAEREDRTSINRVEQETAPSSLPRIDIDI